MDLDWFWRGWFFGIDHVDIAIEDVKWYKASTGDPSLEKAARYDLENRNRRLYISNTRNAEEITKTAVEKDNTLEDFYDKSDPNEVYPLDEKEYKEYLASLTEEEKALLKSDFNYYQIDLVNAGGMVMPVILKFVYKDGTEEVKRIPAEIWRRTNDRVSKVFMLKKEIRSITLDPFLETADVDERNNHWRIDGGPEYFKVNKSARRSSLNTMQRAKK